ncbi:MAG TPA: MupA/Atu3671 family FMN-dependent luciferase-like monooxygenase [Bryobacteraceae bacterium]|nr:MupA/Atu3671 family FMN-dependent luciferase-like monooxygenase [Bryobacteraceae bacterium]
MHSAWYRLAPIQEGMLFHHIQDAHSGVDIEQLVCTFNQAVDASSLRDACQKLVDRHDVLRTSFHWENLAQPMQRVSPGVEPFFSTVDLTALSAEAQRAHLDGFLEEDRRAGFALDTPPLCRFSLFQLSGTACQLVWTFHHAILDGRSFPIVLNELFALYDNHRAGVEIQLPTARPYSQYIAWLDTLDLSRAERFWKEYLRGFVLANPIPAMDPLPAGESGRGELEISLCAATTQALRERAAREEITLNTIVQGAWALILSRYTASNDVVFGATRSCRGFSTDAAERVGAFINTLPVRVQLDGDQVLSKWLKGIRSSQMTVREYEHTPLASIQAWSDAPHGTPLFESILVFDNYDFNSKMQSQGGNWSHRQVELHERTNYPLTLYGYAGTTLTLRLAYDRKRFHGASIQGMFGHLETIIQAISSGVDSPLSSLPMLTAAELRQLELWNDTRADYPRDKRIHELIEQQVDRSPQATAIVFRDQSLTYQELDARANQQAHFLRRKGVQAGDRVAISMERSLDLMVALLATWKAGAAYVPVDPSYPAERLKYVLSDAHAAIVLTQDYLNSERAALEKCGRDRLSEKASGESLAYVIYTSGSTGKPKGVMVSHCNVANFFTAMDQRFGEDTPGTWLAVTSISFDISVLELFWTLARGFKVVLQEDNRQLPSPTDVSGLRERSLDFSLFYFASDERDNGDKYKLLIEGTKFADRNKFTAVWTPERHFHAFGGQFPNPAITSAALAMITEHVQIRAGSVVLPLHDPVRVAEEWAVVDNLSHGRAGISVASGWHDRDFVFAPDNYTDRKAIMRRDLEVVRALWRGESVQRRNGSGKDVSVSIFPRPVQPELPVWITSGGDPQTFQLAGVTGCNLLTHLLGQSFEDLTAKIEIYRGAYRQSGNTGRGHVTLMLHTFVGTSQEQVEELVRTPFCNYLKSSVDLMKQVVKGMGAELSGPSLSKEDLEALIDHAFHRYFATSGLFGTPDSCLATLAKLKDIGVDEVACLVDFGIATETVLANLENLRELVDRAKRPAQTGYSIPEQISEHHVTHMQCTPSLARMLLSDAAGREGLGALRKLLVGGEALPPSLANELLETGAGGIYNMYGPTETTVWSTMEKLTAQAGDVSIGSPIANTSVFVLDANRQPVPIGIPGELYIGGDGVTPGYLDRPELTAERYVDLPSHNQRVYRTGDLVKYLPDGRLLFLGRVDHQVKIRGHRIELGEIEAALCQHPTIQEAIVSAVEHPAEGSALVAYLVKRGATSAQPAELRRFLETQLPSFMIPGAFVVLDALPRTPNGKIDRKRLPHPDLVREPRAVVPPRNPIENTLAAIWKEALRLEAVGIYDNFFDLGGHSLTAVIVTGKIRAAICAAFPLRAVLDYPTIARLAEEIEKLLAAGPRSQKPSRPPIVRTPAGNSIAALASHLS